MRSTRASRRRALLALAVGGLVSVTAACGSDESAGSSPTGPAATTAEPSEGGAVATPSEAPTGADAGSSSSAPPAAPSDTSTAPEEAPAATTAPVAAATGDEAASTSAQYDDGGLDLVGTEVGGASDVGTNPFPDLVVDDLNRGKQVNLRNVIPGQRPVLLWFWAPH